MIPELGHFALILATLVALVLGTLPLLGAHRNRMAWVALARPAATAMALLITFSFACLTQAFVVSDFSVVYVAQHSNSLLPIQYRVAAVWGGHEGSLLLWMLMLCWWAFAVAMLSRQLPEAMVARVLGMLGLVAFGFLLFILITSSPFERLLPAAAEGKDLNPLLQDSGLVIHPPLLYMGYVGFSVAFAFAIAALLSGQLDAAWARWSRPWTMAAWVFLTLGIAMGSWWAYYELGWGGWWFWDPVENASFMPWLVGTALIHSLAVTEKRGSFKNWTVLLAISAFSLSLLGTFLVRSGVLTSVHAFATDPRRGIFILIFLVAVIGTSLALFAWRAPKVGLGGRFGLVSRESLLLTNNVLLVVACATVLLGTLYPLLIDALGVGKISVGPPYFNAVFVPVMTPVLFLMGVAPFARWKEASTGRNRPRRALGTGAGRRRRHRPAADLWHVVGVDRTRPAAGDVDRLHRRPQLRRTRPAHPCRPLLPGRRPQAAAPLLRHAPRPYRHRRLRRRRHHGQQLPGRKGRQDGARRQRRCRRLPLHLQGGQGGRGAELRGGAGRLRSLGQRQVHAQDESRKSAITIRRRCR